MLALRDNGLYGYHMRSLSKPRLVQASFFAILSCINLGCGENEWECGNGEILALSTRFAMRPYVQPILDWWYVNVGDGPSYVVSRCGGTVVTLAKSFYLYPVPDEPSALYCDDDGLYRVDLAEHEIITRLHPATSCTVKDYDGVGGYFFEVGFGDLDPFLDPFLRGESSEQDGLNEIWHVSTLTTPAKPVQIHASAHGPFKLADGWYLHTEAGEWARIDLGSKSLTVIHENARFIVPNLAGDAWVWAPNTDDGQHLTAFVHSLSGDEDIDIGTISWSSRLTWNEPGTHLVLGLSLDVMGYAADTWNIAGINASTGKQTAILPAADGWHPCTPGFVDRRGTGFLVCRSMPDSLEEPSYFYFDPETGAITALTVEENRAKPPEGWEEDDKGYYEIGDGRYITGQSLPGYPKGQDSESPLEMIDYLQMYLVDPKAGTRTALMKMVSKDGMHVSLEMGAIGYTDSVRGGFYIHPLP